jgi:hypothetical protein
MKMPFGKYRGEKLTEIPESYLCWVLDTCEDISPTLRLAIERTLDLPDEPRTRPSALLVPELVDRWYRTLALEFHPDRRGSHDGMLAINRA